MTERHAARQTVAVLLSIERGLLFLMFGLLYTVSHFSVKTGKNTTKMFTEESKRNVPTRSMKNNFWRPILIESSFLLINRMKILILICFIRGYIRFTRYFWVTVPPRLYWAYGSVNIIIQYLRVSPVLLSTTT